MADDVTTTTLTDEAEALTPASFQFSSTVLVEFIQKYRYQGVIRLGVNHVDEDDVKALKAEGIIKEIE